MNADTVVLGAGMVGVSVAIHLVKRGRSVVLLDRHGAAEETSSGNAGLIHREAVAPYPFPREPAALLRYALNRDNAAHYHLDAIPRLAPFLLRYWRNSASDRYPAIARAFASLIAHCVTEHDALAAEAGTENLIRRGGWIKALRSTRALEQSLIEAEQLRRVHGIAFRLLTGDDLAGMEPHLAPVFAGALHWTESTSCSNPQALGQSYARLFEELGGRFARGDARTLVTDGAGWRVNSESGPVVAREAVIALGPWSGDATRALGYRIPLAVKRGYHMHYGVREGARLNNPLLDAEGAYFIGPMRRGIRITTGAEFARRDAPKTPVQLDAAEQLARRTFPIAQRLDAQPWMGSRPCLPDMLPVIGRAPRHKTLWVAFGHHHQGFTLGPVSGRLLAQLMTGEAPLADPAPFSPARFA